MHLLSASTSTADTAQQEPHLSWFWIGPMQVESDLFPVLQSQSLGTLGDRVAFFD